MSGILKQVFRFLVLLLGLFCRLSALGGAPPGSGNATETDHGESRSGIPIGACCDCSFCADDGVTEAACKASFPGACFAGEGTSCAFPGICDACFDDPCCDDGQFCNGVETFDVLLGICRPGTPPVCPRSTECLTGCDPAANGGTGACVSPPINRPNGTSCSDGLPWTCGDRCFNGQCTPLTCDQYGDIDPPPDGDCDVDVDDILLVLDAFSGNVPASLGDIEPCGADTDADVDDILAVLDAFSGTFICPHGCNP